MNYKKDWARSMSISAFGQQIHPTNMEGKAFEKVLFASYPSLRIVNLSIFLDNKILSKNYVRPSRKYIVIMRMSLHKL